MEEAVREEASVESGRKVSVAPMMDCTDRHFRYFLRLISRHVLLYAEMVTTGALLHGKRPRFLEFDPLEKPVAFQLGGSHPKQLGICSKIVEDAGYAEVNLNIGCPSGRVKEGGFGACLMVDPELVARCVDEMKRNVSIPVTVKTRIGIDQQDGYSQLHHFVATVSQAGCKIFIIHARKAWLKGFSPKQNRTVPPLIYDHVYRIKGDFPKLLILINGGITDLDQVENHLSKVDGVMIGRAAYQNPYLLAPVDRRFFNDSHPVPSRQKILDAYLPYVQQQLDAGLRLHQITRHLFGIYHAVPGARRWRSYLSESAFKKVATADPLIRAIEGIAA